MNKVTMSTGPSNMSFVSFPLPEVPTFPNTSTSGSFVSDEVREFFLVMNFVILCKIIVVFGTITNIINIIVFAKIGFKDPVNITLLTLAISDLCSCFSLIWLTICYNPLFQELDLPFDPADFHYLTSGWIHNTFTRITSCITAFITFERCLCVAAPLKVKTIFTPRRVTITLVGITIFVLACVSPIFYTARYEMRFNPVRNKSILSLVFIEGSQDIDKFAFTIHSLFIPIATFFVVVVSTIFLVVNLRRKTKWRENATTSSNSTSLSSRDAKVTKMVVVVATLFIICVIPVFISVTTMLAIPDFNILGRYENMFLIMFSYHFALDSANSALNIFIYYRMSSNYRAVFDQIFRRSKKNDIVKDVPTQTKVTIKGT